MLLWLEHEYFIIIKKALSWNSAEHIIDRRRRERGKLWNDTSRRMAMRHGGGEERKQYLAERILCAASPHKGSSEPAVDTCCLSPVWNTGCFVAMNIVACAEVKRCTPRNAVNTVP